MATVGLGPLRSAARPLPVKARRGVCGTVAYLYGHACRLGKQVLFQMGASRKR